MRQVYKTHGIDAIYKDPLSALLFCGRMRSMSQETKNSTPITFDYSAVTCIHCLKAIDRIPNALSRMQEMHEKLEHISKHPELNTYQNLRNKNTTLRMCIDSSGAAAWIETRPKWVCPADMGCDFRRGAKCSKEECCEVLKKFSSYFCSECHCKTLVPVTCKHGPAKQALRNSLRPIDSYFIGNIKMAIQFRKIKGIYDIKDQELEASLELYQKEHANLKSLEDICRSWGF